MYTFHEPNLPMVIPHMRRAKKNINKSCNANIRACGYDGQVWTQI